MIDNKTSDFIKSSIGSDFDFSIILGSGLKPLLSSITDTIKIPYKEIPGFPVSTVKGHHGQIVAGCIGQKKVIGFDGRFHLYEGYHLNEVIQPVIVSDALGVKNLIVSNAAGGIQMDMSVGDIMFIKDYINFQHCEIDIKGDNNGSIDGALLTSAREIALQSEIAVKEGVYVGVLGPTFETPAEYKMFHRFGGDAIGMSTVPELMVAKVLGMDVFAVSVIVDIGYPTSEIIEISHDIVLDEAEKAAPKLLQIVEKLIELN
ncbi:MAG: purine-nucleoside phosphorylase [Chitinophagales bacterium]|nr:purine-nucleoside phosphorylase [Chitinophagales bacterium]